MSTYLYLECLDHDPPLRSDGEVGQHLYDLPQIRRDIASRDELVAHFKASGEVPDFGHHFRSNTTRFLLQHPKCRIGIRDEYGNDHAITEGDE